MRQTIAAIKMLLVLTVITGVVYPLAVWGIGQGLFSHRANGSLETRNGDTVASSLIGQQYTGPSWFHGRPSAGGYDALSSGASNLGPQSRVLVKEIEHRRLAIARADHVAPSAVPPDAVTASGSGLDPFISPAYAHIQVARVAAARSLSPADVAKLVADNTSGRTLGFLGEPRVNVVTLNLALSALSTGR